MDDTEDLDITNVLVIGCRQGVAAARGLAARTAAIAKAQQREIYELEIEVERLKEEAERLRYCLCGVAWGLEAVATAHARRQLLPVETAREFIRRARAGWPSVEAELVDKVGRWLRKVSAEAE